jgi:hypothetical protein
VALGEYFVGRCTGGKQTTGRTFKAAGIDSYPSTDFNPFNVDQYLDSAASPFYAYSAGANITHSPLMKHLFQKAQHEFKGRFV